MDTISLNANWQLIAKKIESNPFIKENSTLDISIPFEVHDVLSKARIIPEPYYKDNINSISFVAKADWEIKRTFSYKKTASRAMLALGAIDTAAYLTINDREVMRSENEFIHHVVDITEYLIDGENTISIFFPSIYGEIKKTEESIPYSIPEKECKGCIRGGSLIRKSSMSFGTELSPALPTIGIYSDIALITVDNYLVIDSALVTELIDERWHMKAEFIIDAEKEEAIELSLSCQKGSIKEKTKLKPGINKYSISLDTAKDSVELWWPNGLGKQHIYNVHLSAGYYECDKKTAFRTIEIRRSITMGGRELTLNVNGKDIFIKGANWLGLDLIKTRRDKRRYERILESAASAYMNMIRVHGASYYEDDEFYNECDRLGLLVWQDMMFSSSLYRVDKEFLDNIKKEIREQVFRLKSHPSIALWCTDSECFKLIDSLDNKARYIIDYNTLSNAIEEEIKKEDDRYVLTSSPVIDNASYKEAEEENGDIHIGFDSEIRDLTDYIEYRPRFVSEFGYLSLPSPAGASYFGARDDWNATSSEFEAHNRDKEGNAGIIRNIARDFRFPSRIENLMYLSQTEQSLYMERAVNYFRSLMPYCMGTLFMSLNEPWPSISPSSMEYSGKLKLLQYSARRFYSPITPLLFIKNNRLYVYAINDTDRDEDIEIQIKFRTYSGKKKEAKIFSLTLSHGKATKIEDFPLSKIDTKNVFAYARLSTKTTIIERTIILAMPKEARLENPGLKAEVTKLSSKKLSIHVTSTHPAFRVALASGTIKGTFSDNLFAVRPTAERNIIFNSDDDVDIEKFREKLTIYDLYSATR